MSSKRELELEITRGEAPYAPEDQLGKYRLHRWSWREKQDATMESSEIIDAQMGLMEMNLVDYQIKQMLTCITDHPPGIELTKEWFNGNLLDPDVGDLLLEACRKLNGTTLSERASFLGPSEQEGPTPG